MNGELQTMNYEPGVQISAANSSQLTAHSSQLVCYEDAVCVSVTNGQVIRDSPRKRLETCLASADVVDTVRRTRTVDCVIRYAIAVVVGCYGPVAVSAPVIGSDDVVRTSDPPPIAGRSAKDRDVTFVVAV